MIFLTGKPLHDWRRHYPKAGEIAAYLRTFPFLLGWRTKYLCPPICAGFGVSKATAMRGISLARGKP